MVAVVFTVTALISRRTAFGMLIEAVGGNKEASRLVGIRSRIKIMIAYVFCGLCAGIAGLMISSNVNSADGNNAGLWIELDAILAVVIGGTALAGGRFFLSGTIIGALIIQTLTTTSTPSVSPRDRSWCSRRSSSRSSASSSRRPSARRCSTASRHCNRSTGRPSPATSSRAR